MCPLACAEDADLQELSHHRKERYPERDPALGEPSGGAYRRCESGMRMILATPVTIGRNAMRLFQPRSGLEVLGSQGGGAAAALVLLVAGVFIDWN